MVKPPQSGAARRLTSFPATLSIALVLALGASVATLTACSSLGSNRSLDAEAIGQQRLSDADNARLKVVITGPNSVTSGGGVWLGNGQVLTAMHLFRGLKVGDSVEVIIHGKKLIATPLFPGDLGDEDLALLQVPIASLPDGLRSLPGPKVCTRNEQPSNRLYVVGYDTSYHTYASPDSQIRYQKQTWSNATTALFSHGVSGSAVYDQDSGCLAGIISRFESVPSVNSGMPGHDPCVQETRELREGPPGVTCDITVRTVFSSADRIASFLTDAQAAFKRSQLSK